MRLTIAITILTIFIAGSCTGQIIKKDLIIGSGQMPNVTKDNKTNLHIVYGTGDSIMYSFSSNDGKTFSSPKLLSLLPKLAASHTRGPQIAATTEGLVVTACNSLGNIFSYTMNEPSKKWSQTA